MAAEVNVEQYMVGMHVDDAKDIVALFCYSELRIFNENSIITTDYVPTRLNIVHNDKNIITKVYFG